VSGGGGGGDLQEREADDSPLPSTKDKNMWNCTSTFQMLTQRGV